MYNEYAGSVSESFFELIESVYGRHIDFDMVRFLLGDGQ